MRLLRKLSAFYTHYCHYPEDTWDCARLEEMLVPWSDAMSQSHKSQWYRRVGHTPERDFLRSSGSCREWHVTYAIYCAFVYHKLRLDNYMILLESPCRDCEPWTSVPFSWWFCVSTLKSLISRAIGTVIGWYCKLYLGLAELVIRPYNNACISNHI